MTDEPERTRTADDLVNELRARVEARRRSGAYPAGLEEDLNAHYRRIVANRPNREPVDVSGPADRAAAAGRFGVGKIALESQLPAGQVLHRTIARVINRQIGGVLQQMQQFADPVVESLGALATSVEELRREVGVEMASHLDTLYEHVASYERALIGPLERLEGLSRRVEALETATRFRPWYASESFEDEFRGSEEELLERYRDLAERLRPHAPVLDFGCGRGEFLLLLDEFGVDARGVDLDADLVKSATERSLKVEQGDGLEVLKDVDDGSLGALVLIQVVEHLSAQQTLDLVSLAAQKVRPGGKVMVETVNPQSLYVYAHAFYLDPTHVKPVHPSYLSFLFREAGFETVAIDWRSPTPEADTLEEVPETSELEKRLNENIRRLNQLLFAPQDYLVTATR